MKAQMARRLGILGMAVMVALAVGASPAAAQVPAGGIVSTNSPEYRQAIGQTAAQNAINYYYNGCASDFCYGYNPYGYYGGGYAPYYGQQFYYGGGYAPYYGQQFNYGGYPPYYSQQLAYAAAAPVYNTVNYAYSPFYFRGVYYNAGFSIPDNFFTAVGCNVGNYACFYNATK